MREALLLSTLIVLGLVAGCLDAPVDTAAAEPEPAPPAGAAHALESLVEPAAFDAPAFTLVGAVGAGGPVYGAGEPGIWATLDPDVVFLTFPGCDRGVGPGLFIGASECDVGVVYRSEDGGLSWTRLNAEGDGHLAEGATPANGDADVAVDAAGVVYTANLGGRGIEMQRSPDGGDTWEEIGNVVEEDHGADRQWIAAGAPGHVIATWMQTSPERDVAIVATFDGGATWTNWTHVGSDIGWLGTVQFDPTDEMRAFIPYTQPGSDGYALVVARTQDGGVTWDTLDTGVRTTTSFSSFHFSGVLMAPAFDVTGDGTLVYAWSEEVQDPLGLTNMRAALKFVASADGGATWTAPVLVSDRASAIMPWVTGGAGDRFALTYMASDIPLDPDRVGLWDVMATFVDGAASGAPQMVESLIDARVHEGGACTSGGACLLTGADRALLDYFESDLRADGNLVVVYSADPLAGGKFIEIRVAVQSGGTPLGVPGVAADDAGAEEEVAP